MWKAFKQGYSEGSDGGHPATMVVFAVIGVGKYAGITAVVVLTARALGVAV